jgi:hypothetical protein
VKFKERREENRRERCFAGAWFEVDSLKANSFKNMYLFG